MDDARSGDEALVGDGGGTAADEAGKPSDEVGVKVGGGDGGEKESVIDCVKGLRQVNGGDDGAKRRFLFVEAGGDFVGERKKSGDAGATRGEAMLRGVTGKGCKKGRADQAFKDFRSRAKEGNRAI